jgi:hypothetical protein
VAATAELADSTPALRARADDGLQRHAERLTGAGLALLGEPRGSRWIGRLRSARRRRLRRPPGWLGSGPTRPPPIVASTRSDGMLVRGHVTGRGSGSRGRPACRAKRPRRASSCSSQAGATQVASSAPRPSRLLGPPAGRSSSVRSTPATMPRSGSSSSTGASEPFARRARVEQRAVRVGAWRPSQSRSPRSRSDGAWLNCTEAGRRSREARTSAVVQQLRVLDALAQPGGAQASRSPRRRRAPRGSRVADRVDADRPAARRRLAARRPRSRSRDVISTPSRRAARGGRAERPVHEHLEVAGRSRSSPKPERSPARAGAGAGPRDRLPDAQRQEPLAAEALEQLERAHQPSLSWIAVTPREAATPQPSRQASSSSSTGLRVAVAELPGRVSRAGSPAARARPPRRGRRGRRSARSSAAS